MPVVIEDGALVTITGDNMGTNWANVWGLQIPTNIEFDQTAIDGIASFFRGFYIAHRARCHPAWHATGFVLSDLRSATAPAWDGAFEMVGGSVTGDPMPPHVAAVASHRTGLRGKSFRGRTYLSGMVESTNDATGQIGTSVRADIANDVDLLRGLLDSFAGGSIALSVVSRKLLLTTPIVETVVDAEWDRQDRRKRR